MLDFVESPFWTIDEEAKTKYGYNIDLKDLELSERSKIRIRAVTKLFYLRLNPVYQGFPSLWSGKMNVFYQMFLIQVYREVKNELHEKCDLINEEYDLMNQVLDKEQIDKTLKAFVSDPSIYAEEKSINYKSKIELKKAIQSAYQDWQKIEIEWTTMGSNL